MRNLTNENTNVVRSPYTYTYTSSPMALTVLVVVVVLFFIIFFALFARKFFSRDHSPEVDDHGRRVSRGRRAPPPQQQQPPPSNWRVGYYYSPPVRTFGLDPSVVRTLPVLAYGSVGGGGGGRGRGVKDGCVVCLVDFEEMEKVKLIPGCGHVFHPGCIDEWLVLHGSCPICRCSEVCVDLSSRSHEEEQQVVEEEEEEEVMNGEVETVREGAGEERKVVALALGRSRSLSSCSRVHGGGGEEDDDDDDDDERRVGLRRTRSVAERERAERERVQWGPRGYRAGGTSV